MILGVVELFSPLPHDFGVSIQDASPFLLSEDDPRSREELEKLAAENLQNIIYQADPDLIRNWMPIICSALNAGKLGETLILGFSQFALGDHAGLKATLRLLEIGHPESNYQEVIDYEAKILRMRNEFNFGNFDEVENLYNSIPKTVSIQITRNPAEHFSRHRASLAAAFYVQDKVKFFKHFEKIEEFLGQEFGSILHMNMNTYQAMNSFLHGKYIEANEYGLAALKLADELSVNGAYSPFEAAYVLADTYLEFGDNKNSEEITQKYLARAIEFNQYPWITAFYAKLAILRLQEGNVSSALSAIRTGREKIDSSIFSSYLSLPLDIHELIIRMQFDDMERINEIIPRLPNIQISEGFKMAIQMNKNPESVSNLIHLFPENNDQEKFRKELTMAVVNIENRPSAINHLERAIELAIPNGYFRSFLNMPTQIKNYMLDIAAKSPTVYTEKIASAIRNQVSRLSTSYATDHIPLTKRELDVLRRLGTNMPITKIASSMHISNNTIKTHLKNVYRKLNVDSRDEAVARAKELSLL